MDKRTGTKQCVVPFFSSFLFFFLVKKKIEQKKNVFKIKNHVLSVCSLKEK